MSTVLCVPRPFKPHLPLHAPAEWLRETSIVEEPSRELTVHEGRTLQVPCVINTAVDTNLSQVYWSGPQGLITRISSMDANNRLEMSCQQSDIADRVFYVQMVTNVSSDAGTLAQVSLNLHVCNAEQQDSGVYRCGVWTGNDSGEWQSMSLTVTVESTLDGECRYLYVYATIGSGAVGEGRRPPMPSLKFSCVL